MLDVVDGSNEPRVETTTDGHTDQDQTWPMARLALPRPGEVRDRAGIADDVASTFRIDRLVLPPVARVVPMPADDADDAGARRDVDARGTRRPRRIALLVAALIAVTTVAIAIARAGGADAPTRATPSPGADGADGAPTPGAPMAVPTTTPTAAAPTPTATAPATTGTAPAPRRAPVASTAPVVTPTPGARPAPVPGARKPSPREDGDGTIDPFE